MIDRTSGVWAVGALCAAAHYHCASDTLGALVLFVLASSAASLVVTLTK